MLARGGGTADSERAVAGGDELDGSASNARRRLGLYRISPSSAKTPVARLTPRRLEPTTRWPRRRSVCCRSSPAVRLTKRKAPIPRCHPQTACSGWPTHQDPKTGRLGSGSMYEHGLATIAVCEAYGLSKDQKLKPVAESSRGRFIEERSKRFVWRLALHARSRPTVGDTSVVGWQLMGLKSAQMAGLTVNPQRSKNPKSFCTSVAKGKDGGLFSYMPESRDRPPRCLQSVCSATSTPA